MNSIVGVERRGAAVHLFLNKPERNNALDAALVERLLEVLDAAIGEGARLVVLRGEGKSFCSGFDLTTVDSESSGDLALRFIRIEQLLQRLYHYPIDTVALAHGRVFGAGADLFCACNHRICAPGTTFRFPGVRFGVLLGTRRLAARVGSDAAGELVLGGLELDAPKARAAGLATAELPVEAWEKTLEAIEQGTGAIAPKTASAVLYALRDDTREADMAALVASVSTPMFKDQLLAYKAQVSKRR